MTDRATFVVILRLRCCFCFMTFVRRLDCEFLYDSVNAIIKIYFSFVRFSSRHCRFRRHRHPLRADLSQSRRTCRITIRTGTTTKATLWPSNQNCQAIVEARYFQVFSLFFFFFNKKDPKQRFLAPHPNNP